MVSRRKGKSRKQMFEEEPEVLNEDDPAVKLELFETPEVYGATSKDLGDPEDAKEYEEWLKKKQVSI
jgi:hypothetical protein